MLARALRRFPALYGDRKSGGAGHGAPWLRCRMALYIGRAQSLYMQLRRYGISACHVTRADASGSDGMGGMPWLATGRMLFKAL